MDEKKFALKLFNFSKKRRRKEHHLKLKSKMGRAPWKPGIVYCKAVYRVFTDIAFKDVLHLS